MNVKHTPGPWTVLPVESENDYIRVRGTRLGARYKVANVMRSSITASEFEAEESGANARLIAAAPDLLAALTRLLDDGDSDLTLQGRRNLARAAIAKATGEPA